MYERSNRILRMKNYHQQLFPLQCDVLKTRALVRRVPAVDDSHAIKAICMRHQRVEVPTTRFLEYESSQVHCAAA
jgi:hypothetical protein